MYSLMTGTVEGSFQPPLQQRLCQHGVQVEPLHPPAVPEAEVLWLDVAQVERVEPGEELQDGEGELGPAGPACCGVAAQQAGQLEWSQLLHSVQRPTASQQLTEMF